jgi:Uma2 family endonuclease
MTVELKKYRLKVEQYQRAIEAGVFPKNDRLELIDGEIIHMDPVGKEHAAAVYRASKIFFSLDMRGEAIVRGQSPILLNLGAQPEPDVALLRPREDSYEESLPEPADVLLLIEVADSSLEFDREIKLPLYAEAGIMEVWIVNLKDNILEVYRDPAGKEYQTKRELSGEETIAPLAFPDLKVKLSDLIIESQK